MVLDCSGGGDRTPDKRIMISLIAGASSLAKTPFVCKRLQIRRLWKIENLLFLISFGILGEYLTASRTNPGQIQGNFTGAAEQ
jgi:hypothetical protein